MKPIGECRLCHLVKFCTPKERTDYNGLCMECWFAMQRIKMWDVRVLIEIVKAKVHAIHKLNCFQ